MTTQATIEAGLKRFSDYKGGRFFAADSFSPARIEAIPLESDRRGFSIEVKSDGEVTLNMLSGDKSVADLLKMASAKGTILELVRRAHA